MKFARHQAYHHIKLRVLSHIATDERVSFRRLGYIVVFDRKIKPMTDVFWVVYDLG